MLGQAGPEVRNGRPAAAACKRAALREWAGQLPDGSDGGQSGRQVRGDFVAGAGGWRRWLGTLQTLSVYKMTGRNASRRRPRRWSVRRLRASALRLFERLRRPDV